MMIPTRVRIHQGTSRGNQEMDRVMKVETDVSSSQVNAMLVVRNEWFLGNEGIWARKLRTLETVVSVFEISVPRFPVSKSTDHST